MAERVTARPINQFNVWVGDFLAIKFDYLAGIKQHVAQAMGEWNSRFDCIVAGRNTGERATVGGKRTAIGIVVAKAEPSSGKTNLPQHGHQCHQHPIGLLAVVLALYCPSGHDHGTAFGHPAC